MLVLPNQIMKVKWRTVSEQKQLAIYTDMILFYLEYSTCLEHYQKYTKLIIKRMSLKRNNCIPYTIRQEIA